MEITVIEEARRLISRIKEKYPVFQGRTANYEEVINFQNKLGRRLPDWFIKLYTQVPIIDAEFGFQEFEPDGEYDGISYAIWGDISSILEESFMYEPGVSVLEQGYIFIASCSGGSGDHIFINLNHEGNQDPGIYRIYHDDHSKIRISERLTDFFINAII
ncbi:SMI1/KNR4 family protein [Gorillibacterium massiliense]|uniref:SMI1/KNR4 family protein n=1 Tax=Gorillibacterium massiliense TaxID=1280390 RepID=UPI0005933C65|nr:SMI1/KNR4 family protein [Gorillibacterium massiliense]